MKNVFLTFILLVFLAPAGNAFGQAAAVVTFTSPREALAYNELVTSCKLTKNNAIGFSTKKYGTEKDIAVRNRLKKWRSTIEKEDVIWINAIAEMILVEKKSPNDVYVNCMMKGKTLYVSDKKMINDILSGNMNVD